MAKERISSNVTRETRLRLRAAAKVLGLSESKFIAQAVDTDLSKLDLRIQIAEARKQRDTFKAKMEGKVAELAVAEAKLKALQGRGFFARLLNRGVTTRMWDTPARPITPTEEA